MNKELPNNKEKIQEDVQPRRWLLVVLILIAIVISVVLINKIVMDRKAAKNKPDNNTRLIDDVRAKFNTSSFNNIFEMYKGTEYGLNVSSLLDEVITNNKKNKEKLIKVIYKEVETTDPVEIKNLKKEFDNWDKLEVTFDYDDNGYINLVTIEPYDTKVANTGNENSTTSSNTNNVNNNQNSNNLNEVNSEFEKNSFNSYATFHSGTKSGFFVKSMIDYVINNNSTNSNHILFVSYNGINANDANTLNSLKSNFSDFTNYEITISYASDGYANGFVVK